MCVNGYLPFFGKRSQRAHMIKVCMGQDNGGRPGLRPRQCFSQAPDFRCRSLKSRIYQNPIVVNRVMDHVYVHKKVFEAPYPRGNIKCIYMQILLYHCSVFHTATLKSYKITFPEYEVVKSCQIMA